MIIEALKDFFEGCPLVNGGNVAVDFLDKTPLSLSINPEPCEPVIKRYTFGGSLRQYCFRLAVRLQYGTGYDAGFLERLAEWIEEKNRLSELPELQHGKTVQGLEIIKSGHMFEENIHTAGCSMQCRLIYTDKQ